MRTTAYLLALSLQSLWSALLPSVWWCLGDSVVGPVVGGDHPLAGSPAIEKATWALSRRTSAAFLENRLAWLQFFWRLFQGFPGQLVRVRSRCGNQPRSNNSSWLSN